MEHKTGETVQISTQNRPSSLWNVTLKVFDVQTCINCLRSVTAMNTLKFYYYLFLSLNFYLSGENVFQSLCRKIQFSRIIYPIT